MRTFKVHLKAALLTKLGSALQNQLSKQNSTVIPFQISSLGFFHFYFHSPNALSQVFHCHNYTKNGWTKYPHAKYKQTNIPQMPRKLGKPNDKLEPTNTHLMVWRTPSNPDFPWLFMLGGMHQCFAEAKPCLSRETHLTRAQWRELGRRFHLTLHLIFRTSNKLHGAWNAAAA